MSKHQQAILARLQAHPLRLTPSERAALEATAPKAETPVREPRVCRIHLPASLVIASLDPVRRERLRVAYLSHDEPAMKAVINEQLAHLSAKFAPGSVPPTV